MDKIRQGWSLVSRFYWPVIGILVAILGIRQILLGSSDVWSYLDAGTGVTIAFISLTQYRCSNCGHSNSLERIGTSLWNRKQFSCPSCGTRYIPPQWGRMVLYAFQVVWVIAFWAILLSWLKLIPDLVRVDALFLGIAIWLLLVRWTRYEGLYDTLEPKHHVGRP